MRFMIIVKASRASEAGIMPATEGIISAGTANAGRTHQSCTQLTLPQTLESRRSV